MPDQLDDLDALRAIVGHLVGFERSDQERILRWTREKLGLGLDTADRSPRAPVDQVPPVHHAHQPSPSITDPPKDIKTFITEKRPQSDTHFAASVAYYYRFEAPEAEQKSTISASDLQDAARLCGRARLSRPADTLQNALKGGLLDKGSDRGTYTINTVGENLVAMTLPHSSGDAPSPRRRTPRKRKKAAKKTAAKKATKKRRK